MYVRFISSCNVDYCLLSGLINSRNDQKDVILRHLQNQERKPTFPHLLVIIMFYFLLFAANDKTNLSITNSYLSKSTFLSIYNANNNFLSYH